MKLGLRERSIMNEIKILAVVSKILFGLEGVNKKPAALVNVIKALLKTWKGKYFSVWILIYLR